MSAPTRRPAVPLSAIASVIEPQRLEAILAPWLPDPADRAFVVRCILDEGPHHHRGANFVLLSLLGLLAERVPLRVDPAAAGVPVPMRLPPTLLDHNPDAHYPLRLPLAPLERLAARGSTALDAMVDCLTDGPPHHALANAAMVAILGALLDQMDLERQG